MTKLLLMSIIVITVALPAFAARGRPAVGTLGWLFGAWGLAVFAYGAVLLLLPRPGG